MEGFASSVKQDFDIGRSKSRNGGYFLNALFAQIMKPKNQGFFGFQFIENLLDNDSPLFHLHRIKFFGGGFLMYERRERMRSSLPFFDG